MTEISRAMCLDPVPALEDDERVTIEMADGAPEAITVHDRRA
jgi:hypothetical protein